MTSRVSVFGRPAVLAGITALAVAAVFVAALPFPALGQAPDPSNTGLSHTEDLVLARQLLMDLNENAMIPIDRAAAGGAGDLTVLKQQAYTIYTVLSVAPHLFPSSTKPVFDKDGAPTPSTAASPKIWDNFEAFYQQLTDGANLAYDLSQAADLAKFRTLAVQMRTACDSCHEKFMQVYDPTAQPK